LDLSGFRIQDSGFRSRSIGVLENWRTGVLEYWSAGELENWSIGVLECWSAGVLECWSAGVLECWRTGRHYPTTHERELRLQAFSSSSRVLSFFSNTLRVHSGAPEFLNCRTSNTPILQYSNTPILQYSNTPALLSPVLLYSCTPVLLHSCLLAPGLASQSVLR
jgi:hypothetical protein